MQSRFQKTSSGISLVELVVAVALLSIVSLAAIQLMNMTQKTLVNPQTKLDQQLRSEAIAAFIYKDFARGDLDDAIVSRAYTNSNMPEDLRSSGGVTVVSLYGKANRFNGVDPRCPLIEPANPAVGSFQMVATCMSRGGQTIVQQMNDLIAKGIVLTTGLQGGIGRCSISKAITVDPVTNIATVTVDDPNCLRSGADRTVGVPKGNHVLLPRFVAYDSDDPRIFHTTMIEPPSPDAPGIGLEMPDVYRMSGGGIENAVSFVDAVSTDPNEIVTLRLETAERDSELDVMTIPGGVVVTGSQSAKLNLSGPMRGVRQALQTLQYRSPDGFFGIDHLSGKLQAASLLRTDKTRLDVRANCGGQTCGTAMLFNIGVFDNATGQFKRTRYLTSVSICGTELPSTFYGYCGTKFRFDRPDGQMTRYPTGTPQPYLQYCAEAGALTYDYSKTLQENIRINQAKTDPYGNPKPETQNFPFVRYSPKFRGFQQPDRVNVYLYEQTSSPLSATDEARLKSLTNNRFSLVFQFDTFDATPGKVKFTLNNIEQGRNLADRTDPFTFTDDTSEFKPNTIGANGARPGTLTAEAQWKAPNDGVVVPLRLPDTAFDNSSGFFELRHYNHDPDGDGNVNPNLQMISWEGLNGWNIRSTRIVRNPSGSTDSVEWRQFDFNRGLSNEQTDIQLIIDGAQRCS